MNKPPVAKFSFTENGLSVLRSLGISPEKYYSDTSYLRLINVGPDVEIQGRNKFVAFGEKNLGIGTGLQLSLPKGYVAIVRENSGIMNTSLVVRSPIYDHSYSGEVYVNFLNLGEETVTIPKGAVLPASLTIVSCIDSLYLSDNPEKS